MLSLLALAIFVTFVAALFVRRRELFYMLLILLISFTWRAVSVAWLDLTGPVYSVQLFRDIGGNGALPWMVVLLFALLLPVIVIFNRAAMQRMVDRAAVSQPAPSSLPAPETLVFVAFLLFIAMLFADLLRGGTIPLFTGIERWIFTEDYGGLAHRMLLKYGMFVGFFLGLFFASGVQRSGVPDVRFLFVLLVLLGYLFLVGHRFSSFYAFATTFAIPYSTVVMLDRYRRPGDAPPRRLSRRLVLSLQWAAGVLTVVMISYALYVSLVFTRDFGSEGALLALEHRVLVQQGEMWVATYDRVIEGGDLQSAEVADALFVHTVAEPGRNSTIPYLMVAEVGPAAFPMIDLGLNYSGGFPEIFVELFGAWGAIGVLLLAGTAFAGLLYLLIGAVLERRYLSAFFTFYVWYPFMLMSLSGMLNSFVNWKFPIKVGALAIWLLVERVALRPSGAGPHDGAPVAPASAAELGTATT